MYGLSVPGRLSCWGLGSWLVAVLKGGNFRRWGYLKEEAFEGYSWFLSLCVSLCVS
jgi:hypothetical protein